MPTEHLDLEDLNGSDYVDNEALNRNFRKIDPLGKCYIAEAGSLGEWSYKKFSDGTAECWIDDKEFATQSVNQAWGALFTTAQMSFGAYPFSFSSRPFVDVTFNGSDEAERYSYVASTASTSTTQSPPFRLVDPISSTLGNPHFGILVKGRVD